ncbi:hypothetical protein [uncultured Rothia sp.]|uniref:hypothetical protein n=1 Tax=uncultured Rothia sp. TaxID=316088 RepID=UPI0032171020
MSNLLFPENHQHPIIFRDLKWENRVPTIVIEPVVDDKPLGKLKRTRLEPGAFIGIDTRASAIEAEGLPTSKYCAGYARALTEETGFDIVSCPEQSLIEKGKQCARCEARDEFSAMHGIHRGAQLAPAAQAYANLEHWLYIATFPDGTSKVGTSSLFSKPRRLDEQAVALATYVAHADDGTQVRIWEDLVSREAGLVQGKLVSTKFKAWTNPRPTSEIEHAHKQAVSLANWALMEASLDAFDAVISEEQMIDEKWVPSPAMEPAYDSILSESATSLPAFDSLWNSANGFYVVGATGKFLVVHFGDPEVKFLVNLADLANRVMLPYWEISAQPDVQSSLF